MIGDFALAVSSAVHWTLLLLYCAQYVLNKRFSDKYVHRVIVYVIVQTPDNK